MSETKYDIVTVGGGIAGAAIAKAMAEQGAKVLVLERETAFKDRVRGEALMPWGTAEAKSLGVYDAIIESGGHNLRWWDSYLGGGRSSHRDLVGTTEPKLGVTAFYHPHAQETLLAAAGDAGAEIRRGVGVKGLKPGGIPVVMAEIDGRDTAVQARLVVGTDGKDSMTRKWAGFKVRRDPKCNLVAGLLFDEIEVDDEASHGWLNSDLGLWALIFPQGRGRARGYVCYPQASGYRLTGQRDLPRFFQESVKAGMPEAHYAHVEAAGPLSTFEGAAAWVEQPHNNGVALIGAAAADPDPTWGQGLSLSLRDARVLRDHLLSCQDWDEAGRAYAEEHRQYYGVIHEAELWQTELLLDTAPEADARRQKAFAAWREDRSKGLDVLFSGPGPTLDETARRRYFGEE